MALPVLLSSALALMGLLGAISGYVEGLPDTSSVSACIHGEADVGVPGVMARHALGRSRGQMVGIFTRT